ncbi:MAG: hypothetical protein IT261_10400 [Saprospiraceae bacterium]|nr:hypothetical protein [Saprospiraceae bacterium]
MKNIKHHLQTLMLLSSLAILVVVSCKRELEDLEPAEFPNTPEVFIDGFSAGLNYGAFGGSKVTAFDVDTEVKYRGSASMKFSVPDAGDPQGAYAGGTYYTSVGRDLRGYDALTFWAKASKAATIDVVGFGNDFGESKFLTVLNNVQVNSNWQKFIIPIPDASKLTQERGMFFYSEGPEDGLGYTFWIDEVKFEKLGTLAHPRASILNGENQVSPAETGQQLTIGGLTATFNMPTGVDQSVSAAPGYFSFSSSDTSVATVHEAGVVTVLSSGDAVITARLGDIEATGSLTLSSTGGAVMPQTPAPTPTIGADSVISLFSNAYTNVTVDTWNTRWQFSTAEDFDLQIAGDDVKRYRNLNFVGIEFAAQPINATAMTHFHLDIWTPDPTDLPKAFKVLLVDFGANGIFGGNDDSQHELAFTRPTLVTGQWVSLDIPLSSFTGLTNRAHLAQLVLSGDIPNVYVDNVYFYKAGAVAPPSAPTTAAPTPPVRPAADVISIFSDAYTNVPGTDLNPNWGQATVVSQVQIAGNNTLRYGGLNYQGTQFGSNVDASAMTHLHIDFWTANSTLLNVFLISPGPVETSVSLTVPTNGWTSIDIPLSSFSPVAINNLIQFKFEGNGDIYLDNLYFHKGGGGATEPTTAAPTPTYNAANVISVFSNAYNNIPGTNLNPGWGQATQVSQVQIAGNNTLLYTGLNYQGIELGSNQNLTGMTHLHLNVWTGNSTALNVFLISPGPAEKPYALTVPTSGWATFDIPLTEFTPTVDLSNVFQFKFEGNGKIYLDNILFHN